VVGISDYERWPKLPNAVNDAKEVEAKLREMGFDVKVVLDPTSREMKTVLSEMVYDLGGKENRALLFYYAGHGETETMADKTKLGYIIPRDCPLLKEDPMGFATHAISMKDLESVSLRIRSKHVLMIFDSCFSGSLFALVRAVPEDITEKSNLPVRQYITAGREDEQVPDKSMFKRCFLLGLGGDADLTGDGYITGSELGMYLSDKVVNYTHRQQHPQYGKINNPDLDRGDFIFVPKVGEIKPKVGEVKPIVGEVKPKIGKPKSQTAAVDAEIQRLAEERERLRKERERLEAERRLLEERKRLEAERKRLEKEKQKVSRVEVPKIKPETKQVQVPKKVTPLPFRFTLAVFPWLMEREGRYSKRYIVDGLNRVIDKTELFVPTFSYYDLKTKFNTMSLRDGVLSDAVIEKLWIAKGSSPSGHDPSIDTICQLGKQLEVDAVLMYYVNLSREEVNHLFSSATSSRRERDLLGTGGNIGVFLVDVHNKKRYFDGGSSAIFASGEGSEAVMKLTKKVFIDYRNANEKAILAVLMEYQNAWNRKDPNRVVAMYHQDAQIMLGKKKKSVSKGQYVNILPERFARGSMELKKRSIEITGCRAKVKVEMRLSGSERATRTSFSMVRLNNRWLIMKQEY
jgi:ketosteroid isomerase-like protein